MRYEFAQWLGVKTRRGELSVAEATDLARVTIRGLAQELAGATVEQIVATAHEHTISSYDACFVYWAERLNAPLVTQDLRLTRAVPKVAMSLEAYLTH